MDFIIDKDFFSTALSVVQIPVSEKSVKPALTHILFEADEAAKKVTLTGSNLQLSTSFEVEVDSITGNDKLLLPSSKLGDIAKYAAEGNLNLVSMSDINAKIFNLSTEWTILGLEASGFTSLYNEILTSEDAPETISKGDLLEGLKKVSFAVSDDETRESITMVNIGRNSCAATDGTILSYKALRNAIDLKIHSSIVRQFISVVDKIPGSADAEIKVFKTNSGFLLKSGPITVAVKEPEASFPDVAKLILAPTDVFKGEMIVDKRSFISAVNRVRIASDSVSKLIKLQANTNSLTLTAVDLVGNSAEETIPCKLAGTDSFIGAYNWEILQSALQIIDAAELVVRFNEKAGIDRPTPFRFDVEEHTIIVMPLRMPVPAQTAEHINFKPNITKPDDSANEIDVSDDDDF